MAPKNPVGKLAETALSTLKDPKGAAGKVVDQAKGTVALGRLVADTAGAVVGKAAGEATGRLRGKKPRKAPGVPSQPTAATSRPAPAPTAAARPGDLRVVPDVNEPAHTGVEDSPKKQGDVLSTPKAPAKETPAKKGPAAKKAPAKKAPAAKAPAKKAPAAKASATKAPASKASAAKTPAAKAPTAKKSPARKTAGEVAASPADVAEVVEAAVAENPAKTAAKPAEKVAKKSPAKKAAKKAPATKKTPGAKKAPARKTTPGDKLPAKKSPPRSAAEAAANEGDEVRTQAGTTAASKGTNPSTGDTSLTQRETPPVADPSVVKSVSSEQEKLRKAADKNPE